MPTSKHRRIKRQKSRSKAAVSEAIASIALIAATVVIGAVVWVWASSSSVYSENNLGQAAQTDIHAVSERFEIVSVNFTYSGSATSTSQVVIWIYNSGIYNTSISYILWNNSITYTNTAWALPKGQLTPITISTLSPPVNMGDLQIIKAVGKSGSYFTYQAVA